jgi:hypothetical protein
MVLIAATVVVGTHGGKEKNFPLAKKLTKLTH